MKLKTIIRNLSRRSAYALFNISHHQGDKKNIYLFSTRRGGSTWLTQIITSNEGIRYIDHALGYVNADFIERRHMPKVYLNQYISPSSNIEEYLRKVESGELIALTAWKPSDEDFLKESNRLVLKITEAKALIDWLYQTHDRYFIYQIRHPIPTALSMMKLGWGLTADAYLKNELFVGKYLDKNLVALSNDILRSNKKIDKYFLNWLLENLAPLKSEFLDDWLTISYEELVLNPEQLIPYLAENLELENLDKMMAKVTKPSNSSKLSTDQKQQLLKKQENRKAIISKWRNEIDEDQEKRLIGFLEEFEVDCYTVGRDLPVPRLQIFE